MKTLVLGLGNPLLTDDAVGLRVLQALRSVVRSNEQLELAEDYRGGLCLMERMVGFDRAIVIDAIETSGRPGTVRRLRIDELPTRHTASSHDADLGTALRLGREVGVSLPDSDSILIVGVEAADVETFGESCTPPVERAIPEAAETVLEALNA